MLKYKAHYRLIYDGPSESGHRKVHEITLTQNGKRTPFIVGWQVDGKVKGINPIPAIIEALREVEGLG